MQTLVGVKLRQKVYTRIFRYLAVLAMVCQVLCVSQLLFAQSQPTLPPELRSEINSIIGNAISGISVFSSQSSVSSGFFKINNGDDPDSTVDVYRLPVTFDLTDKGTVTPYIGLLFGYLKIVERFPPVEGEGLNDFSRIHTHSAGLSTGVRITPTDELTISPAFGAYYSHTRNSYDYNNEFSHQILEPFGKQLFNWSVDTMTYVPELRIQYDVALGSPVLTVWTKYSHLFNDSISTNSPTIDISSNTGLWQNSLGLKVPLNLKVEESPLSAKTILTRSDIYRSGRKGLEFGYFYEATAALVSDVSNDISFLKELSLGISYSFGEDLKGWRIGVGAEF